MIKGVSQPLVSTLNLRGCSRETPSIKQRFPIGELPDRFVSITDCSGFSSKDYKPECPYPSNLDSKKNDFIVLPSPVGYVRKRFFNGDIDFDFACKMIKVRRETNASCFFSFESEDSGEVTEKYIRSKSSFRGNDVYRARVWSRHKDLLHFLEVNNDHVSYIIPPSKESKGFKCNILKFTLTVDPKGWSRDSFNLFYSQYFYDLFIKRIRKLFHGVVIAKSLEVSTDKARGYLHINVIAIFPNHSFPVYLHTSKKTRNSKGKPAKTWRLLDYKLKSEFGYMWDCGWVDVRAIKNPTDLAEYSLKYHLKYFKDKKSAKTQDLTLSTLSLYNKRAFSFPKASAKRGTLDFSETVIDYTVGLELPDPVVFPRLDRIKHNSLDCEYVGHFLDFFDKYDSKVWYELVDKPPDSLDPLIEYDGCFTPAPVLVSFDYGSRLNESGKYDKPEFELPKYTHQKRFKRGDR